MESFAVHVGRSALVMRASLRGRARSNPRPGPFTPPMHVRRTTSPPASALLAPRTSSPPFSHPLPTFTTTLAGRARALSPTGATLRQSRLTHTGNRPYIPPGKPFLPPSKQQGPPSPSRQTTIRLDSRQLLGSVGTMTDSSLNSFYKSALNNLRSAPHVDTSSTGLAPAPAPHTAPVPTSGVFNGEAPGCAPRMTARRTPTPSAAFVQLHPQPQPQPPGEPTRAQPSVTSAQALFAEAMEQEHGGPEGVSSGEDSARPDTVVSLTEQTGVLQAAPLDRLPSTVSFLQPVASGGHRDGALTAPASTRPAMDGSELSMHAGLKGVSVGQKGTEGEMAAAGDPSVDGAGGGGGGGGVGGAGPGGAAVDVSGRSAQLSSTGTSSVALSPFMSPHALSPGQSDHEP